MSRYRPVRTVTAAITLTVVGATVALTGCRIGGTGAAGSPTPTGGSTAAGASHSRSAVPSAPPPELVTQSAGPVRPRGTPHRIGSLTLTLRRGWRVMPGPGAGNSYVATGACARASVSCRGFRLIGAGGIAHGNSGHAFRADRPFLPAGHRIACPGDPQLTERAPAKPKTAGYWPVGSKRSVYHQWTISCVDAKHHVKGSFSQWTWYLPSSRLLIVDEWDTLTLGVILRWAKWS